MSVAVKPISECRTVAELLATPDRWIKGVSAVDADGNRVSTNSSRACRFCLIGATRRVYGEGAYMKQCFRLSDALDNQYEGDWNDDEARTHEEVLALVTRLGL